MLLVTMDVRVYPRTIRQARLLGVAALLAGVLLIAVEHPLALVVGLAVVVVGLVVLRHAAFVAGRAGPLPGE